jgi:hypothetical protein
MIPRANSTAWRAVAPWPPSEQVEQDRVLSRALGAMFNRKVVAARAIGGDRDELIARLPVDAGKGTES